jgi:hypothetical protein
VDNVAGGSTLCLGSTSISDSQALIISTMDKVSIFIIDFIVIVF